MTDYTAEIALLRDRLRRAQTTMQFEAVSEQLIRLVHDEARGVERDYSQDGEQAVILANTPADGKFLDIGAWDPFVFSNTRALYERGWRGVIVEPSPMPFDSQLKVYGNDERVILVNAAVGVGSEGLIPFYVTDDAVSTTSKAWADKWSATPVQPGKGPPVYRGGVYVSMVALGTILSRFGPFDFINIDVEGESAVLMRRLLEWVCGATDKPSCICVEHDGCAVELADIAAALAGYRVVLNNGCNLILAK